MPKSTTHRRPLRHNPLEADIIATGPLREPGHKKRKSRDYRNDESENVPVEPKQARAVLDMSRELNEDARKEYGSFANEEPTTSAFALESRFVENAGGRDDDDWLDSDAGEYENWNGFDDNEDESEEQADVDPSDRAMLKSFISDKEEDHLLRFGFGSKPKKPLAEEKTHPLHLGEIIMQKILEKEERERLAKMSTTEHFDADGVDEPLSGKIVKACKRYFMGIVRIYFDRPKC